MSGVSGATSKSPSSSSGSHASSSSGSTNKPSSTSSTNKSSQSKASSQSQGSKPKDTFESGSDSKSKKQVDLGGGQGSAQVSHDFKTGETKKSGNVDIAHVDASRSLSTDPVLKRDDQKQIAKDTTASNHLEVGTASGGVNLSAGADDKGVHASTGVHGELTAVKDGFHVKNETTLLNGEKPLKSTNSVDGRVNVGAEGHATGDGYADKNGNVGGHVNVGGSAGADGQITGSTKLSTTDDKGNPEELASASVTLHGNAGIAGGFKAGFDFKDGKLSTEFGFDVTPGVGGGVDTKFSADFGNIAKEGQKIANEIGKGAGDAGYQAQKQIGETLSGIQKFLGGVHLFG